MNLRRLLIAALVAALLAGCGGEASETALVGVALPVAAQPADARPAPLVGAAQPADTRPAPLVGAARQAAPLRGVAQPQGQP